MDIDLLDFAEQLLQSGKDRIPYKFDRRREPRWLRRSGLIRYPDGRYSLSDGAIHDAMRDWRLLVHDAACSVERRDTFTRLMAIAERWGQAHGNEAKFGDLSVNQYRPLWELVTGWARGTVLDSRDATKKELAMWAKLESRGYVTVRVAGSVIFVEPTTKGDSLVSELGSPRE